MVKPKILFISGSSIKKDRNIIQFLKRNISRYYVSIYQKEIEESKSVANDEVNNLIESKISTFVIAKIKKNIAGIAIYSKMSPNVFYIDWVITSKKYRRRGIAKTLVRQIENRVQDKQFSVTIQCLVSVYNIPSIRLVLEKLRMSIVAIDDKGLMTCVKSIPPKSKYGAKQTAH